MDYYHSSSTNGDSYGVLELCLKDILSSIKPLDSDRVKRLNVINELTSLVQSLESLQGAVVKPFGSFASNLFTKWGDLDISVEFSQSSHLSTARKRKQSLLRDIMRVLRRNGGAHDFQYIPNARVPLLIFKSNYQNISCDVSINNHLGYIKSKILLWITDMDERFRDMVLLTKEWAKAQNINDPKSGTLNSYSLCLLVIYHFQTCVPAIFPPLKEIYEGNIGHDVTGMRFITERDIEDTCAANIARFRSQRFSQRNQSSLSQLLISFFDKFCRINALSSGHAICTYTGRLERITSNFRWMEKSHSLLIEDPFEQPENAARAVGLRELGMISNAFSNTNRNLSSSSVLANKGALLASLVRPAISMQLEGARTAGHPAGHGFAQVTRQPIHHRVQSPPRVAYSGFAQVTRQPIHDRVQSPPRVGRRVEYSGVTHVTRHPIHDQVQSAPRPNRYHPSSSSNTTATLASQRLGAENVQFQQAWRPRYTN